MLPLSPDPEVQIAGALDDIFFQNCRGSASFITIP
jgi:hypothetical protein